MRRLITTTSSFIVLAFAPSAAAQSASEGYSAAAGAQSVAPPGQAVAVAEDSGELPFTGLDLSLVAIGGGLLLLLGVALRRRSDSAPPTS